MSMFDWYKPAAKLVCPLCDSQLETWQGKDGPCLLFLWREGAKHPVEQLIDDEEVRSSPDAWAGYTLPDTFTIYSHDCPNHFPIDAACATLDGIWSSTVIEPFRPGPWSKPASDL